MLQPVHALLHPSPGNSEQRPVPQSTGTELLSAAHHGDDGMVVGAIGLSQPCASTGQQLGEVLNASERRQPLGFPAPRKRIEGAAVPQGEAKILQGLPGSWRPKRHQTTYGEARIVRSWRNKDAQRAWELLVYPLVCEDVECTTA
ncbi:unnamed protein product [Prorocentrum cordatum]|uniref:Uncharacterized protein n=1 Tax=Prorocentrum cordatum TaxID=2364126 RepID=A0ABN9SHU6_9DINO|nr:unnamed protein product [Polarella glacialis]